MKKRTKNNKQAMDEQWMNRNYQDFLFSNKQWMNNG